MTSPLYCLLASTTIDLAWLWTWREDDDDDKEEAKRGGEEGMQRRSCGVRWGGWQGGFIEVY